MTAITFITKLNINQEIQIKTVPVLAGQLYN